MESFDKSSKLKFSFGNSRDIQKNPNIQTFVSRLLSPPVRSTASPVCRSSTPRGPDSSLTDEILFQCRRLNPEFTPINSSLQSFVSLTLKNAVDFIIDEKKKYQGSQIQDAQDKLDVLMKKCEDAERKIVESAEIQKKIELREKRLEIEESKLNTEKKSIFNERNLMSNSKKHYLELENEVKTLKEELKNEKLKNKELEKRTYELFQENMEKDSEIQQFKNMVRFDEDGGIRAKKNK
jgi:hypothetical protein